MPVETHTIEHLKSFAALIIDEYHEGTAPDPAAAKLRFWEEIQRCLGQEQEGQKVEGTPLWVRLQGKNTVEVMRKLHKAVDDSMQARVINFRWIGPREEGHQSVGWAVIDVPDFTTAFNVFVRLEESGLNVRDGNFGGVTL